MGGGVGRVLRVGKGWVGRGIRKSFSADSNRERGSVAVHEPGDDDILKGYYSQLSRKRTPLGLETMRSLVELFASKDNSHKQTSKENRVDIRSRGLLGS